ncbi:MAG: hypothetical protein QOJ40_2169 [Verrucomicrobiota bacterium]
MRRFRKSAIVLVVFVSSCVIYIRTHPLVFNESFTEHAHCILIAGGALETYAHENGGRYPFHTNGYGDALVLLRDYADFGGCLTGPGYDGKVFDEAAKTGRHVPEGACGRVYVQGLTKSDDADIALLFDKLPTPGGDHCHLLARLREPLGREVWTIGDGHLFVRESEWPEFARRQIQLLIGAGRPREDAERLYAANTK